MKPIDHILSKKLQGQCEKTSEGWVTRTTLTFLFGLIKKNQILIHFFLWPADLGFFTDLQYSQWLNSVSSKSVSCWNFSFELSFELTLPSSEVSFLLSVKLLCFMPLLLICGEFNIEHSLVEDFNVENTILEQKFFSRLSRLSVKNNLHTDSIFLSHVTVIAHYLQIFIYMLQILSL